MVKRLALILVVVVLGLVTQGCLVTGLVGMYQAVAIVSDPKLKDPHKLNADENLERAERLMRHGSQRSLIHAKKHCARAKELLGGIDTPEAHYQRARADHIIAEANKRI